MAYPPPVLPISRTNADPQQNTHPNDHNSLALAVNDTVAILGSAPAGASSSVQARLDLIESNARGHGCKWLVAQTLAPAANTTLLPNPMTVDTGGFMDTPTTGFVRIPDDDLYTVTLTGRTNVDTSSGLMCQIVSAAQGVICTGYLPIGHSGSYFTTTACTNFGPDTLTATIYNYGAGALPMSAVFSVFRSSIL